jgi:hypothetical protein
MADSSATRVFDRFPHPFIFSFVVQSPAEGVLMK